MVSSLEGSFFVSLVVVSLSWPVPYKKKLKMISRKNPEKKCNLGTNSTGAVYLKGHKLHFLLVFPLTVSWPVGPWFVFSDDIHDEKTPFAVEMPPATALPVFATAWVTFFPP